MRNLIKKIQNTVFQNKLFEKGDKIILAVSGGPDSVCMLDIFSQLQKKYDLELIIAHVNYGLRGKDSDADEKFARKLAGKYGMEILVYKANVGTRFIASEKRAQLIAPLQKDISENALRNIRYNFFEKIRKNNNFDYIAVAHNRDDQAETFLMRVIRGTGTSGLSAMRFKNNHLIRPLLDISRAEILDYLKENNLQWRLDKTNLESKFLRNKIRNILIPMLEKKFNPDIKKTLADSTVSIAEDENFLSETSEKIFRNLKDLRVSKIISLHPAMQRRVLRIAITSKKENLENISSAHIEEALKIITSDKNKPQVVIFRGLKLTRKGDKLNIEKLNK